MNNFAVFRLSLIREREIEYFPTIRTSEDIYNAAKTIGYETYAEEYFGMFCCNPKGDIISYHEISHGDLTSCVTHPREVFKRALLNNAQAIIFVHNHPSGDITPSEADKETTRKLCDAGNLLGIPVLDHIIIGNGFYYSMSGEGDM